MFRPNVADKYASAVTKNKGWGIILGRVLQAMYLLIMHSSSVGPTSFLPIIEVKECGL